MHRVLKRVLTEPSKLLPRGSYCFCLEFYYVKAAVLSSVFLHSSFNMSRDFFLYIYE
ncbi:hypothetical protein Leryth_018564 [Lithospermum erythrorhizon]|nr:hypothetical protein Leryth_018564 [Lithospermum erythrorhizon]